MSRLISRLPLTIANGASLSSAATLGGFIPTVIEMPTAWTAAGISFQASGDGTNYYYLYDSAGTVITYTVDANRRIINLPSYFADCKYLKILSGTPAVPVNQGAERIIYLELWE
jgi:hypothetical protein